MIDKYKEKIDIDAENLNTMPKNNIKNIKLYKEKLANIKKMYEKDQALVYDEIERRNIKYQTCVKNDNIDILNNSISEDREKLSLLNIFSSSYTKSNLDNVLYDLSHFYTVILEKVNEDILKALLIFRTVDVELSGNDFNYSYYSNTYMTKFLANIDKGVINNNVLKDFFEKIYWKCPDIISHIVVNFKYLYCLYKKKFDDYYNKLEIKFNNDNLKFKYNSNFINKDNMIFSDIYTIVHYFLDGREDINKFDSDKIKLECEKIFTNSIDYNDKYNDILNLLHTLTEYKYYLKYKYIIDDIKSLYDNKDKYKGTSSKTKKEINKIEKTIFKYNKKINKLKDKFSKFDSLNSLVNVDILKVQELYNQYEKNIFLEKIFELGDNPTLYDMLLFATSNYNYLIDLIKKDNNIEFVNNEIEELNDFLYYPYINIINNIWFSEDKKIKHVIMDRYNLFGFDISLDELEESNLDSLILSTRNILIYIAMIKLKIDPNKIRFVLNTKSLLK